MDLSSYKPGQDVTRGTLYRRISNLPGHFDHEEGSPDLATFVPRPQDSGMLSAHLDEEEARAALANPRHAGYGLCALDIETVKRETAGRVRVEFNPTKRSKSHVRIHGSTDDEIRLLLTILAEVLKAPEETT